MDALPDPADAALPVHAGPAHHRGHRDHPAAARQAERRHARAGPGPAGARGPAPARAAVDRGARVGVDRAGRHRPAEHVPVVPVAVPVPPGPLRHVVPDHRFARRAHRVEAARDRALLAGAGRLRRRGSVRRGPDGGQRAAAGRPGGPPRRGWTPRGRADGRRVPPWPDRPPAAVGGRRGCAGCAGCAGRAALPRLALADRFAVSGPRTRPRSRVSGTVPAGRRRVAPPGRSTTTRSPDPVSGSHAAGSWRE